MADTLPIETGSAAVLPEGFLLGHAQDETAGTGCTVVICEAGAVGGVSVRGAAPATRETDLLDPRNSVERANAVVLSGGSAFGLDAAGGAMRWLAERGAGYNAGGAVVPIVCGACIFDLEVGDGNVRPDAGLGYAACEAAGTAVTTGNVGVGTGASVGKLLGRDFAMKGGFGAASARFGELVVTALVVVNALGNVCDSGSGQALAGTRDPRVPHTLINPYQAFSLMIAGNAQVPAAGTNTTLGCVLTNGALTKAQAARVADRAHDGLARAIEPIHTGFDGDTIFALSTSGPEAAPAAASSSAATPAAASSSAAAGAPGLGCDLIGTLATSVMEAAVHDAVRSAQSAYGLPSASDLA